MIQCEDLNKDSIIVKKRCKVCGYLAIFHADKLDYFYGRVWLDFFHGFRIHCLECGAKDLLGKTEVWKNGEPK